MKGKAKCAPRALKSDRAQSAKGGNAKSQQMANAIAKPDRIQAGAGRAARLARQGRAGKS
jgi:hypothetical protein